MAKKLTGQSVIFLDSFEGPIPNHHDLNLRIKEDQDEYVIRAIKEDPRRSIFEITEKQWIAHAYTRLQINGTIERLRDHKDDSYPRCVFKLKNEEKTDDKSKSEEESKS